MGYFGSKATSGLCQPLIAMMPPHDTYIETHLGGGAIMRRKPAALRNIGIDRDARALDAFEYDYPVELIHGCAHRFLSEYAFEGSELIYSDPPYLRRTRTSKQRYRFDYEEADHIELLELLKAVSCQVMVSGYRSALYEEWLGGWRRVELQVMNHAGVRTECVWMNFAPDRLLFVTLFRSGFLGLFLIGRGSISHIVPPLSESRCGADWGRRPPMVIAVIAMITVLGVRMNSTRRALLVIVGVVGDSTMARRCLRRGRAACHGRRIRCRGAG